MSKRKSVPIDVAMVILRTEALEIDCPGHLFLYAPGSDTVECPTEGDTCEIEDAKSCWRKWLEEGDLTLREGV